MPNIATIATASIVNLLTAPAGTDFALNAISRSLGEVPLITIASVLLGNTPPDLFEKSISLRYPTVNVFCEKISNTLKEKFRVFSGTASVIIEVRHSQDQIQQVQTALEAYVTAACEILDDSRGDLGNGLFYTGGYDVSFGPLKRGGRNFIQVARVALQIDASV